MKQKTEHESCRAELSGYLSGLLLRGCGNN